MPLALELPFELISRIFIYSLPLGRRVRPHRNRAPLNLAVLPCLYSGKMHFGGSEIRCIMRSFGRGAYNGIPMLFGQTAAASLEDHIAALIDLWFTRAPAYPLSISLICAHGHSLPEQVLTILAKHFLLNQWGRIELAIPMADFLVLGKVIGPFPSLESVTIQITDGSVKALQMSRWMPTTITPAHFAALLDHLPHLVHLSGILARSLRVPSSHGIALKPSLETLLLDDNKSLLNYFAIPTLKHLGVWPRNSVPVVVFLSRSQCHLTSLSLGIYEDTFATTAGEFQWRVPQLRNLIISGKAHIPPYAEWTSLLEIRRAALVHAELHMWHRHPHGRRRTLPPPPQIQARLAALAEGGMTVRITTPGYTWPWMLRMRSLSVTLSLVVESDPILYVELAARFLWSSARS
ncbi:hypothetical protein DFH08DRAFT_818225 [Mycena albidolilacea]|uniref:F-box domain-containing protein n=1 Tax=Mycena albidolilacea TaxID=1033008 RepID=A0AAD7EG00_9AGAR|nr:hypothetical protein DFH08DRAFT_818225 [Mycena albidolilacea]